jgi:hypothetical protein
MDKIALIGPAYHEYKSELLEVIKKKGKVWSLWTYYHPENKERLLRSQFNRDKHFYIYVLDTKEPSAARQRMGATSGSGLVDYRLKVIEFDYEHRKRRSPNPDLSIEGVANEKIGKSCGWYLVEEIDDKIPARPWNSFIDFQTGTNLSNFWMKWPNVRWGYIVDPYHK